MLDELTGCHIMYPGDFKVFIIDVILVVHVFFLQLAIPKIRFWIDKRCQSFRKILEGFQNICQNICFTQKNIDLVTDFGVKME